MHTCSSVDDPPEPIARPLGRAVVQYSTPLISEGPAGATLDAWLSATRVIESRRLTPSTRLRLEDCRRICEELSQVLAGAEPGEGSSAERTLYAAMARGRIQGLCSMFACPRGTFIELLVTAPWNILGRDDPSDPRTQRGAGTALINVAEAWSRRRGCGGRVALQAENIRTLEFYERLGFSRMQSSDRPLSLVPSGDDGWSPSILRVARDMTGPEEERSPWLVLEPTHVAREQHDQQRTAAAQFGA